MGLINKHRKYCYRITHIQNLPFVLQSGIVTKHHPQASKEYIHIGNSEIIDVRDTTPVRIANFGKMGNYVPFYFTPRSMMLFNVITGYRAPIVPKRSKNEILIIRCLIEGLVQLPGWFFTDGQGNDMVSNHYNDLSALINIDWPCIQRSDFSKGDGDFDRPRRYQAEFLVHEYVPVEHIESLNVYNAQAAEYASQVIKKNNVKLAVNIRPKYFFA